MGVVPVIEPSTEVAPDTLSEVPITSGYELAKRIGVPADSGVVVALFPAVLETAVWQEASMLNSKGEHYSALFADCGPWGIRLLDIACPRGTDVKWWQVKEAAHVEEADLIPIRWEGPIGEIPDRYFRDDAVTGIRFYRHSPWFWPREKPILREEDTRSEQRESTVVVEGEGGSESPADADRGSDSAEGGT